MQRESTLPMPSTPDLDAVAFERLIGENRPRLARIARSYAAQGEAEDLLQEILLQLWRAREGFRGQAQAGTWLYRVALNTAISHARRRPPPMPVDAVEERLHSAGDPLDPQQLLTAFLASLDEINRSVLLLSLEGLDNAGIAEVTGMRAGAVATRLTRLRQRFEQDYVGETA